MCVCVCVCVQARATIKEYELFGRGLGARTIQAGGGQPAGPAAVGWADADGGVGALSAKRFGGRWAQPAHPLLPALGRHRLWRPPFLSARPVTAPLTCRPAALLPVGASFLVIALLCPPPPPPPPPPSGRRREALQRAVLFHCLLTSYEMLAAEAEEVGRLEWEALVVDEGHRLKNKEVGCGGGGGGERG